MVENSSPFITSLGVINWYWSQKYYYNSVGI